jgi:hypothetical protein
MQSSASVFLAEEFWFRPAWRNTCARLGSIPREEFVWKYGGEKTLTPLGSLPGQAKGDYRGFFERNSGPPSTPS